MNPNPDQGSHNPDDESINNFLRELGEKNEEQYQEQKATMRQITEYETLKRYTENLKGYISAHQAELAIAKTAAEKAERKDAITNIRAEILNNEKKIEALRPDYEKLINNNDLFNPQSKDYSASREALAWLTELIGEWGKGGESWAEHAAKTLPDLNAEPGAKDQENPVADEQFLRNMEVSAIERLRKAYTQGIPKEDKPRFIELIARYDRLGDNENLVAEANTIAEKLKEK